MKDKAFGKRLKYLRKRRKLRQVDAAKKIGVSYKALQDHEGGRWPNRNNLEKYLNFYKCERTWMLTGEGDPYLSKGEKPDIEVVEAEKQPKWPGLRDTLLTAYEGENRDKVELLLSEGEYTLFERLIVTNTVLDFLDTAKTDRRYHDVLTRMYSMCKFEPQFNADGSLDLIEDSIDDLEKLKDLAVLALSEGPNQLFEFFCQFFNFYLELWDFDFKTYTLRLKPFNQDFKSIPLLISQPQSLFSDESEGSSDRLSTEIIQRLKEFEDSLPAHLRDIWRKTLSSDASKGIPDVFSNEIIQSLKEFEDPSSADHLDVLRKAMKTSVEFIIKRAFSEYLKETQDQSSSSNKPKKD